MIETALVLVWTLAAGPKVASLVSGSEVHIDAPGGDMQVRPKPNQKTEVIFIGKPLVSVRRGDTTLTCRRLVARNDAQGQIETADCAGEVRLKRRDQIVTCDTAHFDTAAGRVVCRGKQATVHDGQSVMRCDELAYEFDSGNVDGTGS